MGFNTEWLFLSNEEDPDQCPPVGCMYPTFQAAMEHVQSVAKELLKLNADIVNLVEVEGCDALEALLLELGEHSGYRGYLVRGTDTYTGQNVALLTRIDPVAPLDRTDASVAYPVANTTCPDVGITPDDQSVSKHYHAQLNVTGLGSLHLYGLHFLARPDDEYRCFEREAQAQVMANFVAETAHGGHVVTLGDMNDYDPLLKDINDDIPISNTLPILRTGHTWPRVAPTLYNVGESVAAQEQRYSNWYDRNGDCTYSKNELSAIDHVLVDDRLHRNFLSSAHYVHNFAPTCATAFSDHWPVMVALHTPHE